MQPASEEEIRRAMRSIEEAPRTETGLLIPPHVAAERRAEELRGEEREQTARTPNRAERRWQEKQARRAAKRSRGRSSGSQRMLDQVAEVTKGMTEMELIQAAALVRDAAQAGDLAQEILDPEHQA